MLVFWFFFVFDAILVLAGRPQEVDICVVRFVLLCVRCCVHGFSMVFGDWPPLYAICVVFFVLLSL